jgi:hypothetical protein
MLTVERYVWQPQPAGGTLVAAPQHSSLAAGSQHCASVVGEQQPAAGLRARTIAAVACS